MAHGASFHVLANAALCVLAATVLVSGCGRESDPPPADTAAAMTAGKEPAALSLASGEAQDAPEARATTSETQEIPDLDPEAAERWLARNPDAVVLDVRTPEEFASGHLEGARNIDFMDASFAEKLAALDRSGPYLIHCASGGRSSRALRTLQELGFQTVVHLDGGLNAWREAGKPVTR